MAHGAVDAELAALLANTPDVPVGLTLTAQATPYTIATSAQLSVRAQTIARPSTMTIFSDAPPAAKPIQLEFSVGGDAKERNYITAYKVISTGVVPPIKWLIHAEGRSVGIAIARLPEMDNPNMILCPHATYEELCPTSAGVNFGLSIQEECHFIYDLQAPMLRSFLQDTLISLPSKIVSWLYYLFPFSQTDLSGSFAHNTIEYTAPEGLTPDDYVAASAMLCLGPFYSQDATWTQQVKRRLESAQARGRFTIPDLTAFTNLVRHIPMGTKKGFSTVDKAMGLVICRVAAGGSDPMAPDSTLATVQQLFGTSAQNLFTSTLYEQLRLVAKGHRQKTLAFGKAIYSIGLTTIPSINAAFRNDMSNLQTAIQTSDGRSYTGLQDPLPACLQIASFPRAALVGIEYHREHLPSAAQKQQFALYITSSISAHITPPPDITTCSHLASLLPAPTTAGMVAIVTAMGDDEACQFLQGRPGSEVESIYKEAGKVTNPCLWYVAEQTRRELVAQTKMADSVIAPLTILVTRKAGDLRTQAPPPSFSPTGDWQREVRQWEMDMIDRINALRPGAQGVAMVSVPGFSALRLRMDALVTAILTEATSANPI